MTPETQVQEYPFKWLPISSKEKALRRELFGSDDSVEVDVVRSEPLGLYMPAKFVHYAEDIFNMKPRTSDIWLVTYPKCGTTWSQVMFLVCQIF